MNKKQKYSLWICLLLFVGIGIYPPWYAKYAYGQSIPHGYHLLFAPRQSSIRVDTDRLLIQWFLFALTCGVFVLTNKEPEPPR
jgi:hypothetical protein